MKRISTLALCLALSAFLFSGCMKDAVTKTEVINVELNLNQDYSYVMSKEGSSSMQITQQGNHFSKSEVAENPGSAAVFNYKPEKDFEGSDEVKISNDKSSGKHGHCHHEQEDVTVYDFKITVKGPIK